MKRRERSFSWREIRITSAAQLDGFSGEVLTLDLVLAYKGLGMNLKFRNSGFPPFSPHSLPAPAIFENPIAIISHLVYSQKYNMTMASSSSTSAAKDAPPPTLSTPQPIADNKGITPLQYGFAAIILGASAGLTLYTKKTSHMLNQLERASANAAQRKGPPKFGPKTKTEWEMTRNRWEKDDI